MLLFLQLPKSAQLILTDTEKHLAQ